MFQRVLLKIREYVRKRQFVVTLHAVEEMDNDDLSIFDIEHCLLSGEIHERQKDNVTAEWKYRFQGEDLNQRGMEVIVKISPNKKVVIITAYLK